MIYEYQNDDKVMCLKTIYPSGAVTFEYCAVGRFDPWPQNWCVPKEEPTEEHLLRRDDGYAAHLENLGYHS